MKNKSLLLAITFLISTSFMDASKVTDKDGNSYDTVQIGSQIWMAANLNVSHFRNGDPIPEAEGITAWVDAINNGKPAWCYYNSDPINGRTYGKLYNWYAIHDPRGLAPNGWHIPSTIEWFNLTNYLGGENVAGGKMKATYGWDNNGNGTNESGFAGLPGGYRSLKGPFSKVGQDGGWWSSSESSRSYAWCRNLGTRDGGIGRGSGDKGNGFSARCLRD